MQSKMAFAMYKPKKGGLAGLMSIVQDHVATLREYEMVTERDNYIAQASDGTVIEVFEWKSDAAKRAAHEHPAVAALWERMYEHCTFAKMEDLSESTQPFPSFQLQNPIKASS